MSRYIVGIDIGGTTFSSVLFDNEINIIKISEKKLISQVNSTDHLFESLSKQINNLIEIDATGNIQGIGISCPGPLNSVKGVILDTPNLKMLQNIKIKDEMESRCGVPIYIENDANLFSLGEWYENSNQKNEIFGGLTLGTGLGFGLENMLVSSISGVGLNSKL